MALPLLKERCLNQEGELMTLTFKNNVIFSCLIATLFTFSASAFAAQTTLLTISNEEDREITKFHVETDSDDRVILKFHQDTHAANGSLIKRITATASQLKSASGLILKQQDKYVIVALKSSNFDEQQGGMIRIDTLVNGATGARKAYDIQLAKDKQGFAIFNSQKRKISRMHLVSNKLKLFGTVGIKDIVMN